MRKLSLDPDQLRVQSFPMQAPTPGRGTVAAHLRTPMTCPPDPTAPPACGTVMRMSCYASCTDPEICAAI
ncbi:MAG TPA: hypothetical protein VFT45_27760 [Longimicrobium sp.]|nr:hypothetical protein [Longimicrobium sp.]